MDFDRAGNGLTSYPLVTFEIIPHATDGICRTGPEIAFAILVKIDGIATETAWNELRHTHGTGVGAELFRRWQAFFARHEKIFLQFLAKEIAARGIGKGQGRQGIQHRIFTSMSTVAGFNTDNCHHNFLRDTELFTGFSQGIDMFLPETHTTFAAIRGDKNRTIFIPGFTFRRTGNSVENTLVQIGLLEHGL